MSEPLKRFYKHVEAVAADGGFTVALDGKPIRTPKRHGLVVRNQKLAEALAAEWAAQEEHVLLDQMLLNQFACSALDYVSEYHAETLDETLGYAETDLLCYRADAPEVLVMAQEEAWDPWLAWVEAHHGVHFICTEGMMPIEQPAETREKLREVLQGFSVFQLTACWLMTKHLGSLILALAVLESALEAPEAFRVSRVDETYQNSQWGEDEETRRRREVIAAEMDVLGRFISLISEEK